MRAILDIIVPVFGMMAIGWGLGRSRLVSAEGLRGLTNVTFYVLFPALLFRSMSQVRIGTLEPGILLVFFGGVMVLFALLLPVGRLLGMPAGDRIVFALSGTFSNGVGIGIPFITYAFGEAGLVPLLMIIALHSLLMLTLASFLLEIAGQSAGRGSGLLIARLGSAILTMLKHPIIPAIFLGLIWSEVIGRVPGFGTPVVVDQILKALAVAAPPCGLIMAGASLAHVGVKEHWQTAALASSLKLAVLPLIVWTIGRYVFPLDPLWLTVATLNSALPAGANVYLVAQLYRTGVGLATNVVVISTGASVFSLSIALLLLGVQGR